MSAPCSPTFDTFFNQQRYDNDQPHARQSSENSTGYTQVQTPVPLSYRHQLSGDFPLTDEPPSLSRHESNASLGSHGRRRAESLADRVRGDSMNDRRDGPIKQDSFPFDPTSTLIATAPRPSDRSSPGLFSNGQAIDGIYGSAYLASGQYGNAQPGLVDDSMFAPSPQHLLPSQDGESWNTSNTNVFPQYMDTSQDYHGSSPFPQQSQSSGIGSEAWDGSSSTDNSFLYNNPSSHLSSSTTSELQTRGAWGQAFLGESKNMLDLNGNQQGGIPSSDWSVGNGMENALSVEDEQHLHELERIFSNPSSPKSQHLSREPTPLDQSQASHVSRAEHQLSLSPEPSFGHRRTGSLSRSVSPFPQHSQTVSPRMTGNPVHAGSLPGYPKPQSPPALIIPNQPHMSPSLPPLITTSVSSSNGQGGVHLPARSGSSGQTSGGLLPPANPALEHLTGMAGISPVGPSTDGPMIYIQPSTPISGLKDGRGVFDAAIRRGMTQQNGQRQTGHVQGQQSSFQRDDCNVPPPASHPLSRNPSSENQNQRPNQASNGFRQHNDVHFPGPSGWGQQAEARWGDLQPYGQMRPRAKSDSYMGASTSDLFDRQMLLAMAGHQPQTTTEGATIDDFRSNIDVWRSALTGGQGQQQVPIPTLDPRNLPGNQDEGSALDYLRQLQMSQQFSQLQAQRDRLPSLNTNTQSTSQSGVFKYEPGEFSPTSLAFYQQLGIKPATPSHLVGTSSAPYSQTQFPNLQPNVWPRTAAPNMQSFLQADQPGLGPRRRSFAEGTNHPASGVGTPGYGMGFTSHLDAVSPGRLRATSPGMGHRRAVKSEDIGRRNGWGMAGAGSTADFLNSITANDGSLLPPSRGRSDSHSRHSSASSARSVSPALSIASQGSSYTHESPLMGTDEAALPRPQAHSENRRKKVAKMKVTSMATEVASASRRTNDGVFVCPIPGCGSTFTRHFNLKGHLRSHNDERPYKCLYDGCPKAVVGFARQHDCKRHMLLHEGLRPFECEGCGKKFARLDALTRHHKSEQGQECAISHPLPVNADGSPMSESQYKIYRHQQSGQGGMGIKRETSFSGYLSGDDRSAEEDMDLGHGSGMEEYDRY